MSGRRRLQHDLAFAEEDLVAVLAWSVAVDHQELVRRTERDQRVVPGAASIVHALPAIGDKGVQIARQRRLARRGHDDKERSRTYGDERLARERMALDHADAHRQRARQSVEYVDADPALLRADIDVCEIAVALGIALIDGEVRLARGRDHIAERCEQLARQRCWPQADDAGCGHAHHSGSPKRRSRMTPPSGMALKRTWVTAPRSATSRSKTCTWSARSVCSGSRVRQNIDWVTADWSVPPVR